MTDPHVSPFQFVKTEDGSMGLAGFPHVRLKTHEAQGYTAGRDWRRELGLPTYFEQWEAMAKFRNDDLTGRRIQFVLMDESETHLSGRPRYNPAVVALPEVALLELGHAGFIVGLVSGFRLAVGEQRHLLPKALGITLPEDMVPQGNFVIAEAALFDSALADKAWQGLQQGLFTHVCPAIFTPDGSPEGGEKLVMVSLVPGDGASIANARVLSWREL